MYKEVDGFELFTSAYDRDSHNPIRASIEVRKSSPDISKTHFLEGECRNIDHALDYSSRQLRKVRGVTSEGELIFVDD